jgi:ankyrin repeat protein
MSKINNSFSGFLSHKVLISPVGIFLATILGNAIEQNKIKTAKQLINVLKKFDSFVLGRTHDKEGNTLLHHAARSSYHEMVKLLIKNKIDVNARNQYGQTPLTLAIGNFLTGNYRHNLSVIEDLNKNRNDGNALFTINLLLEAGANFDKAEYNTLFNIITGYEKAKKHLDLCEKIKKTLVSKCERANDTTEHIYAEINNNHIYDIPTLEFIDNEEPIYDEIGSFSDRNSLEDSGIDLSASNDFKDVARLLKSRTSSVIEQVNGNPPKKPPRTYKYKSSEHNTEEPIYAEIGDSSDRNSLEDSGIDLSASEESHYDIIKCLKEQKDTDLQQSKQEPKQAVEPIYAKASYTTKTKVNEQTHCQQGRKVRFAEDEPDSEHSLVNQPNNRAAQPKSILKKERKSPPETEINGVSQEEKDCSSPKKSAIQKPQICGKVRNLVGMFKNKAKQQSSFSLNDSVVKSDTKKNTAYNTPNSKVSSSFIENFANSKNL